MSAHPIMPVDLEKLEDAPQLLDLLVQMEDVLDGMDIYVYQNWFEGEVVEGPVVSRHFVAFSLLYPKRKMPDPKACLRLLKHGVLVEYNKVQQARATDPADARAADPNAGTAAGKPAADEFFWMVKITFPRRLLKQMDSADLAIYGDDVDESDVEEAKDSGMSEEDAYEGEGDPAMDMNAEDPALTDPAMAAPGMGPAGAGDPNAALQ